MNLSCVLGFSSSFIPMNIVNMGEGGGAVYPGVKCPPNLNHHVGFHFYVMVKGTETMFIGTR